MITYIDTSKCKCADFSQEYLFDANVWIYINGPFVNPSSDKTQLYSGITKAIMVQGGQIFIDVTIMSEFVNRYARLEYNVAIRQGFPGADFKAFRKSPLWVPVAENIRDEVKSIMKIAEIASNTLSKPAVLSICDDIASGAADFNDEIIIDVCRNNGYTLVTHDSDFMHTKDCDIISGNAAYCIT